MKTRTVIFEDGNKLEDTIRDGKLYKRRFSDLLLTFYEDGGLSKIVFTEYKDVALYPKLFFDQKGRIAAYKFYDSGKNMWVHSEYDEEGNLRSRHEFNNAKECHGEVKYFNSDGSLASKQVWSRGKRIK